jgi:threonine dehydrogenase-like Zn-dependent dehydrogenase
MTVDIERQPQLALTAPGAAARVDVRRAATRGAGDALVRPVAAATCDLDTMVNTGRFPLPLPYALGHEVVAGVLQTAPDVSIVRAGDLVAVPFQISCGTLRQRVAHRQHQARPTLGPQSHPLLPLSGSVALFCHDVVAGLLSELGVTRSHSRCVIR